MSKLNEGIMDILDNFLTFLLRNDTKGAKKYIKNHPEIKKHRKELDRRIKSANAAWAEVNIDKLERVITKKEFMSEYFKR